jgi:3-hydroxypropanoate dehydrogenase
MASFVDSEALDRIFLSARTHNAWRDDPVADDLLRQLAAMVALGPTSANCEPARLVFVKSLVAKKRLEPFLAEGNRAKTMAAPVCVIIAYDMAFHEHLPRLFPHADARSWFVGDEAKVRETAFRNGSLQGAYLILAARALGLDAGPMSGFDNAGVDREFFPEGRIRSNFLCNLGYGDPSGVKPRLPRLEFAEFAHII